MVSAATLLAGESSAWLQTEAGVKVSLNFVCKLSWSEDPIPSMAVPRAEPGSCYPDSQRHSGNFLHFTRKYKEIGPLPSLNCHLPILEAASLRQGHCFWQLRTGEERDPGGCS